MNYLAAVFYMYFPWKISEKLDFAPGWLNHDTATMKGGILFLGVFCSTERVNLFLNGREELSCFQAAVIGVVCCLRVIPSVCVMEGVEFPILLWMKMQSCVSGVSIERWALVATHEIYGLPLFIRWGFFVGEKKFIAYCGSSWKHNYYSIPSLFRY